MHLNMLEFLCGSAHTGHPRRMLQCARVLWKEVALAACLERPPRLCAAGRRQGVGACIEQLLAAGLRLWVLTGDKMETAVNIGFACCLLSSSQRRLLVTSETPACAAAEAAGQGRAAEAVLRAEVGPRPHFGWPKASHQPASAAACNGMQRPGGARGAGTPLSVLCTRGRMRNVGCRGTKGTPDTSRYVH